MTREEAIEILNTIPTIGEQVDALEMAIEAVKGKRGKWVDKWHKLFKEELPMCSVCNNFSIFKSDYCPNCGADMRGDND